MAKLTADQSKKSRPKTCEDSLSVISSPEYSDGPTPYNSQEYQTTMNCGEESLFPLAEAQEARVMMLRGYGNAIVPAVAALFISSAMEAIDEATKEK